MVAGRGGAAVRVGAIREGEREGERKIDFILGIIIVKSNLSESRVKLSVSEGQCARAVLCGDPWAPSALSDQCHSDPKMSAH